MSNVEDLKQELIDQLILLACAETSAADRAVGFDLSRSLDRAIANALMQNELATPSSRRGDWLRLSITELGKAALLRHLAEDMDYEPRSELETNALICLCTGVAHPLEPTPSSNKWIVSGEEKRLSALPSFLDGEIELPNGRAVDTGVPRYMRLAQLSSICSDYAKARLNKLSDPFGFAPTPALTR